MGNQIEQIRVVTKRLTPTEAELHIFVRPQEVSPQTELRGRLMGPRCLFSTTIEIAYRLHKRDAGADSELAASVLIPEPNWWHPEAPFLYEGPIELWDAGQCVDRRILRCGLRWVEVNQNGIRWNGKPLTLRGRSVNHLDKASAAELRQNKVNAVFLDQYAPSVSLAAADQYGLLVFLCVTGEQNMGIHRQFAYSPSWMGCIYVGE